MNFHLHLGLAAILLSPVTRAQDAGGQTPAESSKPETPEVEKIDGNRYRIGDVTLDKSTREIRFPAVVNMREGLLEFLIVHENGKIHESLFRTSTSPININVGFALLSYKPSKELYHLWKRPGIASGNFHEVDEETRKAARITIDVELLKSGETKRYPVSDWIRHETTAKAMPPTHWVYGGSEFSGGLYAPEATGDIAAIFVSNSSMINYPGDDKFNDEVWTCQTDRIPDLETKVTIVIAPYKDKP